MGSEKTDEGSKKKLNKEIKCAKIKARFKEKSKWL
jgi:hypothetical protein